MLGPIKLAPAVTIVPNAVVKLVFNPFNNNVKLVFAGITVKLLVGVVFELPLVSSKVQK